jgi:hypothetical protein
VSAAVPASSVVGSRVRSGWSVPDCAKHCAGDPGAAGGPPRGNLRHMCTTVGEMYRRHGRDAVRDRRPSAEGRLGR